MNFLKRQAANCITGLRIALSLLLLIPKIRTPFFAAVYLLCGISDMADGPVARKTGTAGSFGDALDSIADLCFLGVCLFRFLPEIRLAPPILLWAGGIALLRLGNLLWGLRHRGRPIMLHTRANRITGLLLFLFPLSLPLADPNLTAIPLCALALFAALQEGICLRRTV